MKPGSDADGGARRVHWLDHVRAYHVLLVCLALGLAVNLLRYGAAFIDFVLGAAGIGAGVFAISGAVAGALYYFRREPPVRRRTIMFLWLAATAVLAFASLYALPPVG